MNFADLLLPALFVITVLLLGFFLVPLVKKIDQYLSIQLTAGRWSLLRSKAGSMARALRQSPQFADLDGEQRKQYASIYLRREAEKLGFELSYEETSNMIEASVLEL